MINTVSATDAFKLKGIVFPCCVLKINVAREALVFWAPGKGGNGKVLSRWRRKKNDNESLTMVHKARGAVSDNNFFSNF